MVGVTMEGLEKNTVRCPVELRITFEARFCASWTCAGKDARKIDEALDAANAAWAVQPELPCNDKSTMGRKSDDLFVPPTGGTRVAVLHPTTDPNSTYFNLRASSS